MSFVVARRAKTMFAVPFLVLCILQITGASMTEYTAFGDSYAAGIGSSPLFGNESLCYQTLDSYVEQLISFDNVTVDLKTFENRACAGLTLEGMAQCEIAGNVTADPENFLTCQDLSPSPSIGTPDLVTMHMGASSIRLWDLIANCVYFPSITDCVFANDTIQSAFADLASPYGPNFTSFLTDNLTAPANLTASHVKLLSYVMPFNVDDGSDVFCPTFAGNKVALPDRIAINSAFAQLNGFLQNQSAPLGIIYLDINPSFDGHRFCDKNTTDVWLNNPLPDLDPSTRDTLKTADDVLNMYGAITQHPNPNGTNSTNSTAGPYLFGAFHPTSDGHKAIAKLVSQNMNVKTIFSAWWP